MNLPPRSGSGSGVEGAAADSFADARDKMAAFSKAIKRPFHVRYNPETGQVLVDLGFGRNVALHFHFTPDSRRESAPLMSESIMRLTSRSSTTATSLSPRLPAAPPSEPTCVRYIRPYMQLVPFCIEKVATSASGLARRSMRAARYNHVVSQHRKPADRHVFQGGRRQKT
jgi:hypothetical protein